MDTHEKEIEKILKELLDILEIKAKISFSDKTDERLNVTLEGENLGLLIGFRGETLNAVQLFLEIALYRKVNEWVPVTLDIAGYRKEREEQVKKLAEKFCDRAKFFAKSVELAPMFSYDRMIVHTVVSTFPGLKSESTGEGKFRRVIISPVLKP